MSKVLVDNNSFVFVSLGAILGSYIRLKILEYFDLFLASRSLGVFFVNIVASFLLGFLTASHSYSFLAENNQIVRVTVCVGFLGGLSTFSTFIVQSLNKILERNWNQFFSITFFSIIGALLTAFIGYQLGKI